MLRIKRGVGALVLVGIGLLAFPALGQQYPNKTIRIIVPFAAGGAVDTFARLIGSRVSESLGQPVVIENRPGAAGNIGAEAVAKSQPDGYTILQTTNGHALNPAIRQKLSYDAVKDFVPVTQLTSSPVVLVSGTGQGIKTIEEFVNVAKAKPGTLNYGTTGVGSPLHLAMEMLKNAARIDIVHVPYRGDAPLNTALLAGEVQVAIVPLATALPHFQSGTMRALAVTTAQRSAVLPNVPTIADSGFPGFDVSSWQGWFMPANTPQSIVDLLAKESAKALASQDLRDRFKVFGAEVVGSSPEDFSKRFNEDVKKFIKVVKDSNIPQQE